MTARVTAAMWEAKANPGRADALVDWVYDVAVPSLDGADGLRRVEVFQSADHRVVVISLWGEGGEPIGLPDPPFDLIARPPHAWEFEQVLR
ncbi:hypothetical protein [Yinghuangia seranimata]|uniref:hypothetical protein n=1 Tax=Yinghuangia seranimata TaxID=408067 RepID=UPI00248CB833|nr:hypothetical protein [Yinghuangia seranimata]MDI2126839.1 hypothetical protein [Yinghuangia seranimata]